MKTRKITFLILSLAFAFTLVLTPIFAPKTAHANTVSENTNYDTVYCAQSGFTFRSGHLGTSSSTLESSIELPMYYQFIDSEDMYGSTGVETWRISNELAYNSLLSTATLYSYPRVYTYWKSFGSDYSVVDTRFGRLECTNKICPRDMLRDLGFFYINNNVAFDLEWEIEVIPTPPYNGDTYTYAQPYNLSDRVVVSTGARTLQLFDADYIYDKIGSYSDVLVKSFRIDFIGNMSTNQFNGTPSINFNFPLSRTTSTYLTKSEYIRDYEYYVWDRYLSDQREDNAVGLLFAPISAFLRTELFPGFTFGTLVLISIAVAMLGFFLGVLRNG